MRSKLRNRFHIALNLTGLTLTAILLIALYLYNELTFDKIDQGDRYPEGAGRHGG